MFPDNDEPEGFPDTEKVTASPSGSVPDRVKLNREPTVAVLLPIELRLGAWFATTLIAMPPVVHAPGILLLQSLHVRVPSKAMKAHTVCIT